VDSPVENRSNLWETFSLSTGRLSHQAPAARCWGRTVDSQTHSHLQKYVVTHNPQALLQLLPFLSLSLLNRTGSSL
jgi:hypothetical protein